MGMDVTIHFHAIAPETVSAGVPPLASLPTQAERDVVSRAEINRIAGQIAIWLRMGYKRHELTVAVRRDTDNGLIFRNVVPKSAVETR